MSDPKWIVEPFLVEGSSMMIYGRQGYGKTRLLWQLAYAVASGEPWLFYEVDKPGPVIFLELDMPMEEFRIMMRQAENAGLLHKDIYVLRPEDLVSEFNIMSKGCQESLYSWIVDLEPSLLVLDTINDAFYTVKSPSDINAAARDVVRTFQGMISPGAFVYSNHKRKEPSFRPKSDDSEDSDAFLGPGAWERQATSSISLDKSDGENEVRTFHIRKHRLASPSFRKINMHLDASSFFVPHCGTTQLLATWPIGAEEPFKPSSQADVIAAVAAQMQTQPDTVKKTLQRMRRAGAEPRWLRQLDKLVP